MTTQRESIGESTYLPRDIREDTVAIVGLGHVGFPLSMLLSRNGFNVIGYDINSAVVQGLSEGDGHLPDLKLSHELTRALKDGKFVPTSDPREALSLAQAIIVAVPTPVDDHKMPNLSALLAATRTIGENLQLGQLICYESTVFPGCIEEQCIPVLEESSGLRAGYDFDLAYCPERYSPGDSERTIEHVDRIIAGIDARSLNRALHLYQTVLKAKVWPMKCIRDAEAAKVIENAYQDLNIAFANEVALACETLGLDANEVLDGCATKFNFVRYEPGPGVGGHCIPVDPLYLAHVLKGAGRDSSLLQAARIRNDTMPAHIVARSVQLVSRCNIAIHEATATVLGLSYKRDIADMRGSPALSIVRKLREKGARIRLHDPICEPAEVKQRFLSANLPLDEAVAGADLVIICTDHEQFRAERERLRSLLSSVPVVVDTRGLFRREDFSETGTIYYRLGDGVAWQNLKRS